MRLALGVVVGEVVQVGEFRNDGNGIALCTLVLKRLPRVYRDNVRFSILSELQYRPV